MRRRNTVARADVVLDCTGNMATRQEINAACVSLNTPLVAASAVGFGGQLMVLATVGSKGCYRCLWPDDVEPERNCRTAGIVSPVVGVIEPCGRWKPSNCSGIATPSGELRLFDGKTSQWRSFALRRASGCGMWRATCRFQFNNDEPMQCAGGTNRQRAAHRA